MKKAPWIAAILGAVILILSGLLVYKISALPKGLGAGTVKKSPQQETTSLEKKSFLKGHAGSFSGETVDYTPPKGCKIAEIEAVKESLFLRLEGPSCPSLVRLVPDVPS